MIRKVFQGIIEIKNKINLCITKFRLENDSLKVTFDPTKILKIVQKS